MIQLRITKQKLSESELFYLPSLLSADILHVLRAHEIPCTPIKRTDIVESEAVDTARQKFLEAGWKENIKPMSAIQSTINPDDLFDLCTQFFGPTIDKDYRKLLDRCDKENQEYYQTVEKILDHTIFIRSAS